MDKRGEIKNFTEIVKEAGYKCGLSCGIITKPSKEALSGSILKVGCFSSNVHFEH